MTYSQGQHGPDRGPNAARTKVMNIARKAGAEGVIAVDIAKDLGITYAGARYHLERLTKDGWLMKTGVRKPDDKGWKRSFIYWAVR